MAFFTKIRYSKPLNDWLFLEIPLQSFEMHKIEIVEKYWDKKEECCCFQRDFRSQTQETLTLESPAAAMGRVRTKTVKKSSRQVIERYYSRMTLDFHTNKKILEEVAIIPSKRLRNKIAGFSTHLMRRIQRGPVRGISLKLQEEERERRMDFVPEESAIKVDQIEVDKETLEMLASIGMADLPGVEKQVDVPAGAAPAYGGRGGYGGPRRNWILKVRFGLWSFDII